MLSIVLFHYASQSVVGSWSKLLVFGAAGVHLFMFLAGFGLMLSRYSMTASVFYRRRFVRILVPYYLFVTFAMLVNLVHAYYPGTTWYAYFGHIFWYKMFDARIIYSLGGQLWFVSAILALYLAYPLLAAEMRRFGPARFLAGAIGISAAYWVGVTLAHVNLNPVFSRFFLQFLWEFCLGMVLADVYKRTGHLEWERPIWVLWVAFAIGYAALAFVTFRGGRVAITFDDVPSLVGFSAMTALAYRIARRAAVPVLRSMIAVGGVSFELYLVHMLVKAACKPLLPPHAAPWVGMVWVVVVMAVAVAAAFAFQRLTQPLVDRVAQWLLPAAVAPPQTEST